MKRIVNLLFVCVVFCFASCSKETDVEGVYFRDAIFVCGKLNPKWLIHEIERIEQKSELKRFVEVKKAVFDGSDVIRIEDPLNSCLVEAVRFFDCSGNCYDSNSDKYFYFLDNYDKFELVWMN